MGADDEESLGGRLAVRRHAEDHVHPVPRAHGSRRRRGRETVRALDVVLHFAPRPGDQALAVDPGNARGGRDALDRRSIGALVPQLVEEQHDAGAPVAGERDHGGEIALVVIAVCMVLLTLKWT